jgi:hypothetical protein
MNAASVNGKKYKLITVLIFMLCTSMIIVTGISVGFADAPEGNGHIAAPEVYAGTGEPEHPAVTEEPDPVKPKQQIIHNTGAEPETVDPIITPEPTDASVTIVLPVESEGEAIIPDDEDAPLPVSEYTPADDITIINDLNDIKKNANDAEPVPVKEKAPAPVTAKTNTSLAVQTAAPAKETSVQTDTKAAAPKTTSLQPSMVPKANAPASAAPVQQERSRVPAVLILLVIVIIAAISATVILKTLKNKGKPHRMEA